MGGMGGRKTGRWQLILLQGCIVGDPSKPMPAEHPAIIFARRTKSKESQNPSMKGQ
jgi:hypothetical protein